MHCLYFICERKLYARKNYATPEINPNGGFPLLRDFHLHTIVNFTPVDKIEAMCGRSRVNVKVEPGSTFTFTLGLLYIASTLLRRVKCPRKLRNCGNHS